MNAISAPVLDSAGRYCASLAIHAPAQRMPLEVAIGYRDALFGASRKLTETLFS